MYITPLLTASTSKLEQRVCVSYDIIDVYDRKCVWSCGVPSVRGDRRPSIIIDGLRRVHEAHVPPVCVCPVRVVGRGPRSRQSAAKRVFDIHSFQSERFLFDFPLKQRVSLTLSAQHGFPFPVSFLDALGGDVLRRQHAGRFEVVGTRKHHAPADGINCKGTRM